MKKNNYTAFENFIRIVQALIGFVLIFVVVYFVFCMLLKWFSIDDKQPCKPIEKKVLNYEPPKVADTIKNDWVKDPGVCIERRIVYEQILNDIDR